MSDSPNLRIRRVGKKIALRPKGPDYKIRVLGKALSIRKVSEK